MVIDLRNFLGRDTAAGGEAEIFAQVLKVEATFPGGKKQGLTFERGGSGGAETYLGLTGAFSANVHLAPRAGAPSVA